MEKPPGQRFKVEKEIWQWMNRRPKLTGVEVVVVVMVLGGLVIVSQPNAPVSVTPTADPSPTIAPVVESSSTSPSPSSPAVIAHDSRPRIDSTPATVEPTQTMLEAEEQPWWPESGYYWVCIGDLEVRGVDRKGRALGGTYRTAERRHRFSDWQSLGLITTLNLTQPNARMAVVTPTGGQCWPATAATLNDVQNSVKETVLTASYDYLCGSPCRGYVPYEIRMDSFGNIGTNIEEP